MMDEVVLNEMYRIRALEGASEFENQVRDEIFTWVSAVYGTKSLEMSFREMAEEFWKEKLNEQAVRKIVR
jgi:trehalose/maltose hydrolase-like predicted phosphorylase